MITRNATPTNILTACEEICKKAVDPVIHMCIMGSSTTETMTMTIIHIMTTTDARTVLEQKIDECNEKLGREFGKYEHEYGDVPADSHLREMFSIVARFMNAAIHSSDAVKEVLLPVARDMFFDDQHPRLTILNRIHSLREELRGYRATEQAIDEGRIVVGGNCPPNGYSPAGFHPDQRVWATVL